jgi:hypothetical protein
LFRFAADLSGVIRQFGLQLAWKAAAAGGTPTSRSVNATIFACLMRALRVPGLVSSRRFSESKVWSFF